MSPVNGYCSIKSPGYAPVADRNTERNLIANNQLY